MLKEAIYHKIDSDYAYPVSKNELFLKLRTKRGDCSEVNVICYDKYKFIRGDKTSQKVRMEKKATDELFDYYECIFNTKMLSISYLFELINKEKKTYYANYKFYETDPVDEAKNFLMPYLCEADIFDVPQWAEEAIVYQIFVDRFYKESFTKEGIPDKWYGAVNYETKFGGNIKGITEKIDYLKELGINTIYLTPVFLSGSNHKYNTFDYFTIDPEFGTKEDLVEMVKKAHDNGIRVILDAVFNHSGHEFLPFKDVLENGENSRYREWFDVEKYPLKFEDKCNYATFGYIKWMPKIMTKCKEASDYLIEIAQYWIREADIDGWRLDVANEVDHRFWRRFREAVKSIKSDAVIIGEVWHDSSSWLQGDQFDTVMNYLFTGAVGRFVVSGAKPSEFADELGFMRGIYRECVCKILWNLIDSHDTKRFLNIADESIAKLKMAALIQMSVMGTPMLYYGDEVGMTGGRDPDNRRGMYWDDKQNQEVLDYYKAVIKIRKDNIEFSKGDMKIIMTDDNQMILGYERSFGKEKTEIYLNNGKKGIELRAEKKYINLVEKYEIKPGDVIKIKGKSGVLLKII